MNNYLEYWLVSQARTFVNIKKLSNFLLLILSNKQIYI